MIRPSALRIGSLGGLSTRLSPAYAAALVLVVIQVGIGLMYKAAQTGGKYAFSATSSVTISESLKFLLSTFFFYKEWVARGRTSRGSQTHLAVSLSDIEEAKREENNTLLEDDDPLHPQAVARIGSPPVTFYQSVKDEIPIEVKYGFVHLALFYVLINNIVFVLFRLADPGTIQLIKSGTTLITAIVMIVALGTTIAPGQWVAIVFQVCGIIVTQYSPSGGSAYPFSTYMFLFFQTTLSAISSVYNQKLCKSSEGSLHVMNMHLYSAGAIINLILHVVVRIMNREEPGFFTGYGHPGALMVIVSNVFIGLAMTAVYKYADALIKCFATAFSTAILLYISPLLFDVSFSFLVLPGTLVVFMATWLYMDASPKKSNSPSDMQKAAMEGEQKPGLIKKLLQSLSPFGVFRRAGLIITTSICFIIIAYVTHYRTTMIPTAPTTPEVPDAQLNKTVGFDGPAFESPFKNVIGFIRVNLDIEKRIETSEEGYLPYFHSLHFSMPNNEHLANETNLKRDYWQDGFWPYPAVAEYLKLIEDDPAYAEVEGLMWFHFDSWVSPLAFHDMDRDNIWVLDTPDGPPFICQKELKRYKEWTWFEKGWHDNGKQASRIAQTWYSGYDIDPEEFCLGWSDMYYIPRRFFKDFINLSLVFASVPVFHEIAMPMIFNIIDRTYSEQRPHHSVLTRWSDCWGSCCRDQPLTEDIEEKRCGHKMDWLKWEVTGKHFDRLRRDSLLLGKPIPTKEAEMGPKGPVFRTNDEFGDAGFDMVRRHLMMI